MTGTGTRTSDTTGGSTGLVADAAGYSGANDLLAGPSPLLMEVNATGRLLTSATTLAGGAIGSADDTGSSFVGTALAGGSLAFSVPGSPLPQPSFATVLGPAGGGQPIIAFNALGVGEVSPAFVLMAPTGVIRMPLIIAFNPGNITTQESPAAPVVVSFGFSRMAPPVTETPDGYVGITTTGASSLGSPPVPAMRPRPLESVP